MIFRVSLFCLFLGLCTPVLADSVEEGINAVEQQDFLTAYKVFSRLAQEGDVEAQHNLAVLYKQGKGVMKDAKKAAQWFRKAADKGLADAQYYLGHMYDTGQGVEQSPGYAVVWYRKAAEQGNALAQTNLGVLYASGQGVKQDLIQAYVWFSVAAAQGIQAALDNRELIAKQLSAEQITQAKQQAREYFDKYIAPRPHVASPQNQHPKIENWTNPFADPNFRRSDSSYHSSHPLPGHAEQH